MINVKQYRKKPVVIEALQFTAIGVIDWDKIYEAEQTGTGIVVLTPINVADVMLVGKSSQDDFIKIWLNSTTLQEVATETGKTAHQTSAYAHWLKTKGVNLPKLKRGKL